MTSSLVTSATRQLPIRRPLLRMIRRSARSKTSLRSWADEEDAEPLVLQRPDEPADLPGLVNAERRGGLVHDQDAGVEVDGPGDRDRLALPAGQPADRLVQSGEPRIDPVQHIARLPVHATVVHGAPGRAQLPPEKEIGDCVEVVGERERLVDGLDSKASGVAGAREPRAVSPDVDFARSWRDRRPRGRSSARTCPRRCAPGSPGPSPFPMCRETPRTAWTPPNRFSTPCMSTSREPVMPCPQQSTGGARELRIRDASWVG